MAADNRPALVIDVLTGPLSIVCLPADAGIPSWVESKSWYSMTRTSDELSIVCESRLVPPGVEQTGPWRALRVEGPLDFDMTGILYRIVRPLADAKISIFAVSTFDTDYVLVLEKNLRDAVSSLGGSGIVAHAAV
ncbi:MAG: hypothetical protein MAG794_01247 [Gammaproteobacteria bacterium]|nr:hypothetical protein [Gammaproteobacteria bacterium]